MPPEPSAPPAPAANATGEKEMSEQQLELGNQIERVTVFGPKRKYRYTLWREFPSELAVAEKQDKYVQFIGLNPSTADEKINDPTIRRCMGYAQAWGYGAMCMTNLFAFRATDPEVMIAHNESNDARYENAQWIEKIAMGADLIICAWGRDGHHLKRGEKVSAHLSAVKKLTLHHLGLNADGTPKHPLYLKKNLKPIHW